MIENMVNKYRILIDLRLEVMVLYCIRMYEKGLPEKIKMRHWTQKEILLKYTLAIFSSVMIMVLELRTKQRHMP
jgi:hypothetical protein